MSFTLFLAIFTNYNNRIESKGREGRRGGVRRGWEERKRERRGWEGGGESEEDLISSSRILNMKVLRL